MSENHVDLLSRASLPDIEWSLIHNQHCSWWLASPRCQCLCSAKITSCRLNFKFTGQTWKPPQSSDLPLQQGRKHIVSKIHIAVRNTQQMTQHIAERHVFAGFNSTTLSIGCKGKKALRFVFNLIDLVAVPTFSLLPSCGQCQPDCSMRWRSAGLMQF